MLVVKSCVRWGDLIRASCLVGAVREVPLRAVRGEVRASYACCSLNAWIARLTISERSGFLPVCLNSLL